MTIHGTAVFEHPIRLTNGVLRVRLIDVDRIDAPSISIAEGTVRPLTGEPVSEVPFSFDVDDNLLHRRRYELAAHLDLDVDGSVSPGDFVTMEAFPWRPDDRAPACIRLRQVPHP